MKQFITFIAVVFLFTSCIEQQRIRTRDKVVVDGDEIPGTSATKQYPDTCLAYYSKLDNRIHIQYLMPGKLYWTKTIYMCSDTCLGFYSKKANSNYMVPQVGSNAFWVMLRRTPYAWTEKFLR